jgi:hypothetical protein
VQKLRGRTVLHLDRTRECTQHGAERGDGCHCELSFWRRLWPLLSRPMVVMFSRPRSDSRAGQFCTLTEPGSAPCTEPSAAMDGSSELPDRRRLAMAMMSSRPCRDSRAGQFSTWSAPGSAPCTEPGATMDASVSCQTGRCWFHCCRSQ